MNDPNIELLSECITDAHKRIKLYEMLQGGLWYAIFRSNSNQEILKEKELIEELERMKLDVIEWDRKVRRRKKAPMPFHP